MKTECGCFYDDDFMREDDSHCQYPALLEKNAKLVARVAELDDKLAESNKRRDNAESDLMNQSSLAYQAATIKDQQATISRLTARAEELENELDSLKNATNNHGVTKQIGPVSSSTKEARAALQPHTGKDGL